MSGGIYLIVNMLNGRHYVGSTNNFSKRKREHFNDLKNNKHSNQFFQRDYDKCGEEGFQFVSVVFLNEDLLIWEQIILDQLYDNKNVCYNIAKDALAPMKGRKNPHSVEWRKKIGDGNRGKIVSDEAKKKISESHKGLLTGNKNFCFGKFGKDHPKFGKVLTKETKEKMSKSKIGKSRSEEVKKKISETLKKRLKNERIT